MVFEEFPDKYTPQNSEVTSTIPGSFSFTGSTIIHCYWNRNPHSEPSQKEVNRDFLPLDDFAKWYNGVSVISLAFRHFVDFRDIFSKNHQDLVKDEFYSIFNHSKYYLISENAAKKFIDITSLLLQEHFPENAPNVLKTTAIGLNSLRKSVILWFVSKPPLG